MQTSNKITLLKNSRTILLELLKTQNYITDDYEKFSNIDIDAMYSNGQMDMLIHNSFDLKKVYVKYLLNEKKMKFNILQGFIEELFPSDMDIQLTSGDEEKKQEQEQVIEEEIVLNKKKDTLIFVSNEEPNATIMTKIEDLYNTQGIFVIIFSINRLQFNILNHQLVPEHIILNDEEIVQLKKRFHFNTLKQLPEISRFDPVAQAIMIRPKQICRIIRNSVNAVKTEYYRCCV